MNKFVYLILGLVILLGGFFALNKYIYDEKQADIAESYRDATYVVDGKSVKLENGYAEVMSAEGSATKIVTKYFGNEVKSDLDGDGREDVVFLLTQETGGSGTFYYVVSALNTSEGYVGSQALLLGDRIAPQTTEIGNNGIIVVNYAERAPGESFAIAPSVGKSIWLKLDIASMQFGEVVQNFEGEADPSRMTLGMKKWIWISALYNDGRIVTPKKSQAFTLSFSNDGRFSATTDCNGVGGKYIVKNGEITFSEMMSTLMYCENSQENEFTQLLTNTTGYHFTSKGELIFDLKFDSGTVIFR